MKKLVVVMAMGFFTVGSSLAGTTPGLVDEISEKVSVDLSTITLDKFGEDFVKVQFKIYDGLIQIQNIEASQADLKELIIDELREIHVRTPYSESKIHNYKFTFEKK